MGGAQLGLLLDTLASSDTPTCFMMRKREAETDPMQKIDQVVGSGPFVFNQGETRPGSHSVYDNNAAYVPRAAPPRGIAGEKGWYGWVHVPEIIPFWNVQKT